MEPGTLREERTNFVYVCDGGSPIGDSTGRFCFFLENPTLTEVPFPDFGTDIVGYGETFMITR